MKRLSAKIDEYTDQQTGKLKGRYVELGVILKNENGGEYALLNPTVDLAGVMMRQRMMAPQTKGKGVLCGIFDDLPQTAAASTPQTQGTYNDDDIPF